MPDQNSNYFPNVWLRNAMSTICIEKPLSPNLPLQERERVREETKKIEESFQHLGAIDRVGSTISLYCMTRLYILKLNALEQYCKTYRRIPKPGQSNDLEDNYEYEWTGQKSFNQERLNFQDYLLDVQNEGYGRNVLYRALPVVLTLLLAAFSVKLATAGVLFSLLIWWAYKVSYCILPASVKRKLKSTVFDKFSRNPAAQHWAGILKNIGPFLTIGLYAIPPIALIMIIGHWLARTTGLEKYLEQQQQKDKSGLVLRQNLQIQEPHEEGFIHSRAFAMIIMAIFASGLPAFFSYYLYCTGGVDAIMGYPSREPQFLKIMFIQLYLLSVSSCLSVLFFRAWFTFPLNFLSAEYDIDLTETKIEKQSAKGWFAVCMFWGWQSDLFSSELLWKDVRHVDFSVGNSFRLYPLPPVFFKEQSKVYRLLNRLAALFDAVSKNKTDGNRLEIVGKHGEIIEIRLNELDSEQKKDVLFYIRKYAPQATISEKAQKALVGSTVLRDPKHTELWFDLLLDKAKREHAGYENSNLSLRNGQYTISRKLASGGQASVYLTKDREGKSFILKEFVLPEGKVQHQLESMVEFENESLILSRLDHPQIVRLKDQFIENCRAYLVIEYVEGKTLREIIREEGALGESQVLSLAKQMVAILSYLENQNPQVVHRDFTPDNLILQPDGRIKLIDFSISHLYQAGGSADCAGKHSYTPPEQYRGEATPQSDIYAFGATLAFLLTGKDPQPIATSHPKQTVPEISQQMDNLVSRATAIALAERYESCKWIELDLEDSAASCT
ncbi:MAG: Serine/threonine protein kinase [Cyanobacteriota bacterium erpe_2018_sw_21hr_WHONDRS-SW48-000092_B_bin.40]|nr:Serine/threonine protein kinase [Cyanobacteriota bacterium erpe_2018_sw_21hr_WHONDRS-SW48-000092_B_bin.40]